MEKVIKDGKIAVLYSPGFGAGWFTWNRKHPECLFHPAIVKLIEEEQNVPTSLCKELFGEDFYTGGSDDLQIEWLDVGTAFRIDEYDGSESIDVREMVDWIIA